MNLTQLLTERLFHEIHVSEIREFQKCEWAWDWKYNQQLYPKKVAKPLEFGTAMHAAMEALYDPDTWNRTDEARRELAESALVAELSKQKIRAVKNFGNFFNGENQHEDYAERLKLGLGMLDYYVRVIAPTERNFTPRYVEQSFAVPVKDAQGNIVHCFCASCSNKWNRYISDNDYDGSPLFTGLPVCIEGKIDLVLEYENGKVWVRDWKNIGRFVDNMEWLDNDLQLNIYLWALWSLGLDIGGFEYYELRKGYPQIPEPMEKRYRGRMFSTSKSADYDYTTYLATVKEQDEDAYDAGLYDDYLQWLQEEGPQYYKLTKAFKNDRAMQEVNTIVYRITKSILKTSTNALAPSPTKYNCLYCDFRQPCIERMSGADYKSMLEINFDRKPHYYEDQEDET